MMFKNYLLNRSWLMVMKPWIIMVLITYYLGKNDFYFVRTAMLKLHEKIKDDLKKAKVDVLYMFSDNAYLFLILGNLIFILGNLIFILGNLIFILGNLIFILGQNISRTVEP
jgi:hypothetical protein